MNWIDVLLIGIVLLAVWSGWQRGFIAGVLHLVTWLGSLVIGFYSYPYVADFMERHRLSLGVWTTPVAIIGTIILARVLLSLIANRLLRNVSPEAHRRFDNKLLGTVPGFVNGVIYATLAAALLLALPLFDGLSSKTRESKIANELAEGVTWLDEKISPVFDEAVKKTVNNLTVHPKSNETVNLHFRVSDAKVRQDLEARMLGMVNAERAKEGLPPLKADPELTQVARAHSRDMFARGYFAHVSPEGKTPSDRIRAAHVRFVTAGENLALAQTLNIAHKGLMNSPGHRANILHKAYGRLGIGILDGGIYGLMVTQNFRN